MKKTEFIRMALPSNTPSEKEQECLFVYEQLVELFERRDSVHMGYMRPLRDFADANFLEWRGRDGAINTASYYERHIFKNDAKYITEADLLRYCNFLVNMLTHLSRVPGFNVSEKTLLCTKAIFENIRSYVESLNKHINEDENGQLTFVTNDEVADIAIEAVKEIPKRGDLITEYNSVLPGTNIERKREILLHLAHTFEGLSKDYECNGVEELTSDIGFLVNDLNIRHNNEGAAVYQYLKDKNLEEWYDRLFNLLVRFFTMDCYVDIYEDIWELKWIKEPKKQRKSTKKYKGVQSTEKKPAETFVLK